MKIGATALALTLSAICLAGTSQAQLANKSTAGLNWSSSWDFSNTAARQQRLNQIDLQQKLENGYYSAVGTTTFNTYYDSSVGDTTVTAAEGSEVILENRTGDGSGTSSTTIGASNTTMNEISVEGSDNILDLTSTADSIGCQDGSIQISSATAGGVDISASGGTSSNASSISNGSSTCN